ncbi:MAG: hypothetical protein RL681_45 [Candidatus Parcubacteria bacterium]|jgi:6-phosphogluconolactonase/glucosamine-6-phosphate isomerase/deaminase
MEILIYPESERVHDEAVRAVNGMLEREFGVPLLFLLSGGSSLGLLDGIRAEFLGPHVTIGMSDERLSTDPAVNNFAQMVAKPFYGSATNRGCAFIDTRPLEKETVTQLGTRFNVALNDWRKANPQGKVVMTMGIGSDGHTCGIMPFQENEQAFKGLFEEDGKWAVGYDAAGKSTHPLRATVTVSFLKNGVDEGVAYAIGWMKRRALKRSTTGDIEIWKTPASVMREMKKVTLFTNQNI